jgi:membrane-bound lytic murein transglycosylase A
MVKQGRGWSRAFAALLISASLGACTIIPQVAVPTGAVPIGPVAYPSPAEASEAAATPAAQSPAAVQVPALVLGLHPGPALASLPLANGRPRMALHSFTESCPKLVARVDSSGLTRAEDWAEPCAAAPTWPVRDAAGFFVRFFETAKLGDGKALVTGYYEPEIAGTRQHQPGFDVPIYGLPADLVRVWPDTVPPDKRIGTPPPGRMDEAGHLVPYSERAAIEDGALANKGLEIAWAADPVELFFLEVQGSGRLVGPNGQVMRIGYAGQNGRDYVAIGGLLRARGLVGDGAGKYPASMEGIIAYLRDHPSEGKALMRENPSYVFFREGNSVGPVGALGVPVRTQSSLAADPLFVPLGAPVWLGVNRVEAGGLWISQDTGGAIKGANRFDSFWGAGPTARTIAGGMVARGDAVLLLPKGTLARLGIQ